jgi:hypothetical protein
MRSGRLVEPIGWPAAGFLEGHAGGPYAEQLTIIRSSHRAPLAAFANTQ